MPIKGINDSVPRNNPAHSRGSPVQGKKAARGEPCRAEPSQLRMREMKDTEGRGSVGRRGPRFIRRRMIRRPPRRDLNAFEFGPGAGFHPAADHGSRLFVHIKRHCAKIYPNRQRQICSALFSLQEPPDAEHIPFQRREFYDTTDFSLALCMKSEPVRPGKN